VNLNKQFGRTYRTVEEDFCGEEGIVFVKVAIVKDKKELDPIIQSLDGVRDSPGRILSVYVL